MLTLLQQSMATRRAEQSSRLGAAIVGSRLFTSWRSKAYATAVSIVSL
jgi:hypothetical protein